MRCTVLGASGFIGSHLAARLRAQGAECFTPARGDPAVFQRDLGHIFYCIGMTADFRTRPFETVRAHVCVLADVLERARFDSLLYLSSTRLYAGRPETGEEAPVDAADVYNASKAAGEALCLASGRDTVRIARLSNVVGEDTASENFIPALVRAAVREGAIRLATSLDSEKDYIGLEDAVALLPRLALHGAHRRYNIASGFNVTHREIVERIRARTGCRVEVAEGAPRVCFPRIDIDRARAEFQFVPRPVLECIDRLVDAIR